MTGMISKASEIEQLPSLKCMNIHCKSKKKYFVFPNLTVDMSIRSITSLQVCHQCHEPLTLISVPEIYLIFMARPKGENSPFLPIIRTEGYLPWGIIQRGRTIKPHIRTIKIRDENSIYVF